MISHTAQLSYDTLTSHLKVSQSLVKKAETPPQEAAPLPV